MNTGCKICHNMGNIYTAYYEGKRPARWPDLDGKNENPSDENIRQEENVKQGIKLMRTSKLYRKLAICLTLNQLVLILINKIDSELNYANLKLPCLCQRYKSLLTH